jgi:hypothetical protein
MIVNINTCTYGLVCLTFTQFVSTVIKSQNGMGGIFKGAKRTFLVKIRNQKKLVKTTGGCF